MSAEQNWSVHNSTVGAPDVKAYKKAANNSNTWKNGAPVLKLSTGYIDECAVSSSLVTDAAFLGFSMEDTDPVVISGLFGIPKINDPEDGIQLVNVAHASPLNRFILPLKSDQAPALTDCGTVNDLGYDGTNDVYYVNKASAAHPLVRIESIVPGNTGVNGGLVVCSVPDAYSQAPGGDVAV